MAAKKTRGVKRRSPNNYHHGDLRRALLNAALEVIARDGVDAVKLSDLAKSLRVSVAAPFRHFATREALLVTAAEEGADLLIERMTDAAEQQTNDLEAQRARGVAYVRFSVEKNAYFRLLIRPELLQASEKLQALSQSNIDVMEPALGKEHVGKKSHEIAIRSAGLLAAQALTYGLARMIDDGHLGELDGEIAETLAHELTGVLGKGLIARE